MGESAQKVLSRVRPPRVNITYDVETNGAIQQKSLPFIVGILADLSGQDDIKVAPALKDRSFIQIDRDNFNGVLKSISPKVTIRDVANKIPDDLIHFLPIDEGTPSADTLTFPFTVTNIDDFTPANIAQHLHHINLAYETQNRLRDILGKLDGNDKLINILSAVQEDSGKSQGVIAAFDGIKDKLVPLPFVADDGREASKTQQKDKEEKEAEIKKAWDEFDGSASEDIVAMLDKDQGCMILDDHQKPYAYQMIAQYALDILAGLTDETRKVDPATLIVKKISDIQKAVQAQINAIMHNQTFQDLEAAWRGLHYLVMKTETGEQLKLRLFVASKSDLLQDLKKAVEFDQSALFKKVYEDEYGTYGGDPFSMLVGDYEFGRSPVDMELLEKLSSIAAQAHTPFITSAWAKLFDLPDFNDLAKPRDLAKIFESAELIKWRSFRDAEDSRYVTLTLPKVMLRFPYGPETLPAEDIDFAEDVDGSDSTRYLWGNSAYFLTERITNAFAKYGWTAAIRGVEGGGLVEGLPTHVVETKDGDKVITCPTQIAITDRREKELNDLGFVSLCHRKGWGQAAFFGGQTTNKPKKYNLDSANSNASLSAMLPYMLNASRFAHYIKVIMREKIGSFQTRSSIEEYLNAWIAQYVLLDESAGQESKAAYPLQQGRVVVSEVPGKPGSYKAVVFLRPHFQLEELTASIRLVADIPA